MNITLIFYSGKNNREYKSVHYNFEEDSASERNTQSPQESLQTTVHFQLPTGINSNKHHDVSLLKIYILPLTSLS